MVDFGGKKLNFIQIGLGTNATFIQNLAGNPGEYNRQIGWLMQPCSERRPAHVRGIAVEPVKQLVDALRPIANALPHVQLVQAAIGEYEVSGVEIHGLNFEVEDALLDHVPPNKRVKLNEDLEYLRNMSCIGGEHPLLPKYKANIERAYKVKLETGCSQTVDVWSWAKLAKTYNFVGCEVAVVDAEGSDVKILKSIRSYCRERPDDWPSLIQVETMGHCDSTEGTGAERGILETFQEEGYTLVCMSDYNSYLVRTKVMRNEARYSKWINGWLCGACSKRWKLPYIWSRHGVFCRQCFNFCVEVRVTKPLKIGGEPADLHKTSPDWNGRPCEKGDWILQKGKGKDSNKGKSNDKGFEEILPARYTRVFQPRPPPGPPPAFAIAGKRGGKGGNCGPPPALPAPHDVGSPIAPMRPPPQHVIDECLGRARDAIGKAVWGAVQKITHMETTWSSSEVSKKLTKYIYKSFANPALVKGDLSWNEICKELVKGMFSSYQASCSQTAWFYAIDLATALGVGAMVLLPVLGWRLPPQQVFDAISSEYMLILDRVSLDSAMWQMVENLFADDEKSRSKIWNAISKAYDPALRAALDPTPMDEISRVKIFMKTWIDDFACRAWGGLGDAAESTLTEDFLVDMFDHLLQPFGEDHPFSAIPRMLTKENGPPPPGWDFLPQVVQRLCSSWGEQAANPTASKKRKKSASEGFWAKLRRLSGSMPCAVHHGRRTQRPLL